MEPEMTLADAAEELLGNSGTGQRLGYVWNSPHYRSYPGILGENHVKVL